MEILFKKHGLRGHFTLVLVYFHLRFRWQRSHYIRPSWRQSSAGLPCASFRIRKKMVPLKAPEIIMLIGKPLPFRRVHHLWASFRSSFEMARELGYFLQPLNLLLLSCHHAAELWNDSCPRRSCWAQQWRSQRRRKCGQGKVVCALA